MRRSALLISSSSFMTFSSIIYSNSPSKASQYTFSISCAFLGFITFLCYIVHSESTFDIHVFKKKLKVQESKDHVYYSESESNLFNFYTKGAPEVESDSAPPCVRTVVSQGLSDIVPEKEKIPPKSKMVTFRGETETDLVRRVDLEEYPSSPRKYRQDLVQPLPSKAHILELGSLKAVRPPNLPSTLTCSAEVEVKAPQTTNLKEQETMTDVLVTPEEKSLSNQSEEVSGESDVLDKISHDLDYLLNGQEEERGVELAPVGALGKSPRRDLSNCSPLIARTSL